MPPIRVAVHHVVHDVHDAREAAEDREGCGRARERRSIEQLAADRRVAEQQAGEDEQVLGPLTGTQRQDQVQRDRPTRYRVHFSTGRRRGRGKCTARHLAREAVFLELSFLNVLERSAYTLAAEKLRTASASFS